MSSKLFHCEICNFDVKGKTKHLKTTKHLENLNGKTNDDIDKKKCCQCRSKRPLDWFNNENRTCNKCLEYNREYKKKNKEKNAEMRKERFQKMKHEVYKCPICDYEIKKYNKGQHERGVGHKHLVELKERGEEPEKPEKIITDKDGIERLKCGTCKLDLLKSEWASHLIGNFHLKCKTKNDCKKDILENQYMLTDCYNCCDE